jgi:hypothetical protein
MESELVLNAPMRCLNSTVDAEVIGPSGETLTGIERAIVSGI